MKLIDKDALVAEIERLKADALQKKGQCKRSGLEKIMHQIGVYNKILSFLNTLEVKEVDLEVSFDDYMTPYNRAAFINIDAAFELAKHFFELGMQQSKK